MSILKNNITALMNINLPELCLWVKDRNHLFLGSNTQTAEFCGFKNPNDMLGISDHELRCDAAALAEIFQTCEKKIMATHQVMKSFDIVKCATGETRIMLVHKEPLMSKKNRVVGTFGRAVDITKFYFNLGCILSSKLHSSTLTPSSFTLQDTALKYNLTQRQAECLFFSLHYKTAKQIAAILNISARTVEEHLFKLKLNFGCATKSELLEKATDEGFLHFIPPSIFNRQLSIALAP